MWVEVLGSRIRTASKHCHRAEQSRRLLSAWLFTV